MREPFLTKPKLIAILSVVLIFSFSLTSILSCSAANNALVMNIGIGTLATSLVILLVVLMINQFNNKLDFLSIRDDLTGLFSRRKFHEIFEREAALSRRENTPLCLLMLDIDHFKTVNINFGHQIGDQLIINIAQTLQDEIRVIDVIGRWGGEEFVILLHNSQADQAFEIAERLREAIAEIKTFTGKKWISQTISIGIAITHSGETDFDTLITAADQALCQAKQKGCNRTYLTDDAWGEMQIRRGF